jgi:hypothetical protein
VVDFLEAMKVPWRPAMSPLRTKIESSILKGKQVGAQVDVENDYIEK